VNSKLLAPTPVACILIAISTGMAMTNVASGSGPQRSVNDGVFTAQQADRGAKIYAEHCVVCHGTKMLGGPASPGVAGLEFKFWWNGKSVGELYESTRTKMPPGRAGMLSDQEYIDAVAAILRVNGFPPGEDEELPADHSVLDEIMVTWPD
jgi:quinoprotein glucose dehydrogenase